MYAPRYARRDCESSTLLRCFRALVNSQLHQAASYSREGPLKLRDTTALSARHADRAQPDDVDTHDRRVAAIGILADAAEGVHPLVVAVLAVHPSIPRHVTTRPPPSNRCTRRCLSMTINRVPSSVAASVPPRTRRSRCPSSSSSTQPGVVPRYTIHSGQLVVIAPSPSPAS